MRDALVASGCAATAKARTPQEAHQQPLARIAGEGGAHCEASAKQWEGEGTSKASLAGAAPSPGSLRSPPSPALAGEGQ
jgi:hypothetical protein